MLTGFLFRPTSASVAFVLPYLEDAILPFRASLSSAEHQQKECPYSITIHTTLRRSSSEVTTSLQEDEMEIRARFGQLAPYVQVRWAEGRPSLNDAVVASQVATRSTGKMALIACGPPGFCDDARAAAAFGDGKGGVSVDYYEESFTW